MFLLHRGPVARAHRLLMLPPAFTDSDVPQAGIREAVSVLEEMEMRVNARWVVVRAKTQVLIDAIRVHEFSRIHLPFRIPHALELAESVEQFVPEHLIKVLSLRLTVAVLAR